MPSWNIHTAHVERLLAEHQAQDLGIADVNAFLFGNYVPDIYLGFMVQDTTFRIDYCLTHLAMPSVTPLPNADEFWDTCVARRLPNADSAVSLTLGAWAHLVADRVYNGSFRDFCETHDTPKGDELRLLKQGDFNLFGHSLGISSIVEVTPELLEAANRFRPYSVLPDDVRRAADVANAIVRGDDAKPVPDDYQLLSAKWMNATFDTCNEQIGTWLVAWQELEREGNRVTAEDVRVKAGLPCLP